MNFVASEKKFFSKFDNWNQLIVSDALVKKGSKVKFNPPSAPHHGGVWECLVRSFKHVSFAVLGNRRLTDEILTTRFCLVEQCLNARPITPVSPEATDLDNFTLLLGTASSTFAWHFLPDMDHRRYVRAQAYSDAI